MARLTNAELENRLEALEAENAALRERVAAEQAAAAEAAEAGIQAVAARRSRTSRSWGWTLLAVVLIVIGAILAPVAVASSWAKNELSNTNTFVDTFAPLSHDPGVQAYITTQTVDVINKKVNFKELTSNVIDGITNLGTGPRATAALNALKGPAASGLESLLTNAVSKFVKSDAFSTIWSQALRVSHTQLIATLENKPNAVVAIGPNSSIGIQLKPIIQQVKAVLLKQGLTFASQIPVVNQTITIAKADSIGLVQLAYGVANLAGTWLPWLALLFFAAGVLVARRRAVALVWAAVALALTMILLGTGYGIVHILFVNAVSPSVLPSDAATEIYNVLVSGMRATTVAVAVLAIAVAVVAWLAGPFRIPRALRGFAGSGFAWVRRSADAHGIGTGRVGEWLYAQRLLLRVLIALIAAAVVLFVRPLTPGLIIWTLVIAVIVVAILELVQRPPGEDVEVEVVVVEEVEEVEGSGDESATESDDDEEKVVLIE